MSQVATRPVQQKPPKEPPDRTHLSNVAKLPCMVCCQGPTVAHHLLRVPGGTRGTGKRNSDRWVVPLCAKCHRALHDNGNEVKWFKSHGIDYQMDLARDLWRVRESFGLMMDMFYVWRKSV